MGRFHWPDLLAGRPSSLTLFWSVVRLSHDVGRTHHADRAEYLDISTGLDLRIPKNVGRSRPPRARLWGPGPVTRTTDYTADTASLSTGPSLGLFHRWRDLWYAGA